MDENVTVKPLRRAERMKKAPPKREIPRRADLLPLLAKYDTRAPRYTSYPPATQFTSEFDCRRYLDHISRVTQGGEWRGTIAHTDEISLYVHLPFCDTLCFFCGCNMIVSNNREKISEYLQYLKREITLAKEMMEFEPIVVQMHWGGGSPTHLTPAEIEDLGMHIRETFTFSPDAEISIEIDPRGVTRERITAMEKVGFDRASIGVQDFNSDVQIAINRVQPKSVTRQVIEWCRDSGVKSINLDLIYGLPYQTTESFGATLDTVIDISPERVAVYNFAYVPWIKPHQSLIAIDTLPSASNKLALLELAIEKLTAGGYEYLGMDHFAKPTDSLFEAQREGTLHRNFQGYSTFAGKDLYAFGISAIGRVENFFVQNVKELPEYYRAIDSGMLPIEKGYKYNADDEIREYVIMQLMCNFRVDKNEVERLFGVTFDDYFSESLAKLRPLAEDNLCILAGDEVRVTTLGRYFLRNIAVAFDAYMTEANSDRMFSKAV